MPRAKRAQEPLALTVPNDIQLVSLEKNLDIMGFFIADEFRGKNEERPTERVVEYTMTRESRPHLLRYTLKGTSSGLPNSTDKDVWNAIQSLLYEQKKRDGFVSNPATFTARQVFHEMGAISNGLNYKKINDCLIRFKETTISSADVVYNSLRKKYNEKHFSVITRWEKVGASDLDGNDRNEFYQVSFDQTILDNLNVGYVLMENIVAYRKLTRPAAKVIIGNIYYWFGAADEPYASRDYKDLCNLLGITCYRHKSKIEEKLGPSLDELIDIGYLSKWEIQRSSIKVGFKVCMWAGPELLRVLKIVKEMHGQKQKSLPAGAQVERELTESQKGAMNSLIEHGVKPNRAKELASLHSPESIYDQIEYGLTLIEADKRGRQKLDNPPGYLIWRINDNIPIPSSFFEARKREREARTEQELQQAERYRWDALNIEYVHWKDRQIEAEIEARFKSDQLDRKLDEIVKLQIRPNKVFERFTEKARRESAFQMLRRDIATELMLPNFEDWTKDHPQGELF